MIAIGIRFFSAYSMFEQVSVCAYEPKASILKQAVGQDWKARVSVVFYLVAILVALRFPQIAEVE
jgi:hypothetical protein